MVVALSIVCYVFFVSAVRWIAFKDEVDLLKGYLSKRMKTAATGVVLLSFYRYDGLDAVFMAFYLLYLLTSAYIDAQTMYVYSFLNRIALMIGFLMHVFHTSAYGLPKGGSLLATSLYIGWIYLQSKWEVFGEGDGEAFVIVTFFLAYFYRGGNLLYVYLLQSFLSSFLFTIANVRHMDWKRLKMKRKRPFVPSVFIANLILCIGPV